MSSLTLSGGFVRIAPWVARDPLACRPGLLPLHSTGARLYGSQTAKTVYRVEWRKGDALLGDVVGADPANDDVENAVKSD